MQVPAEQSANSQSGPASRDTAAIQGNQKCFKRLKHAWRRLQIGHRSMYSVERLYALDAYCRTASQTRVVMVCLLTPLPALLLVVAVELIPLQNPTDGWASNYGAWVRLGVISWTVGLGLTVQMKGMLTGISIPMWKLVAISSTTTLFHVGITIALGAFWVFPVPFCFVLTTPPFLACMTLVSFVAVGREALARAPNLRQQLSGQIQIIIAQGNIAVFYIGLSAVFATLPSQWQLVFVALLPLIKLIFKNVVASVSGFLEEFVPGIVVFSVELAHALFATTCMQTARSPVASAVIITFDALSSTLALRSIHHSARTIDKLLGNHSKQQKPRAQLMDTVTQICQNPLVFPSEAFEASNLRLRSALGLTLSPESRRALGKASVSEAAENTALHPRENLVSKTQKWQPPLRSLRVMPLKPEDPAKQTASVVPVVPAPQANTTVASVNSKATVEEQVKLVCETAQLMFHCEYIVLIEYVECVIPMVYGLYLQALFRLGGDALEYYPQTRGFTMERLDSTVSNLVVYVWLEVLSLVVLHVVLHRRFGFSILRQLAFVLETHAMQVQGRMFVWIAFILTFSLEHFGSDFTFRFQWMRREGT